MRKLAMLLAALVLGGACSEEIIEPPPDPPFVMTVVVVPESVTIDYRETETFNVVVVDQYGELMPDARVEWTSIDSDIASVTEGTVAGASHGVTQVVAFVDGVADTAMVDVAFSQRGVLLKLYDSTNGDQWLDAKNWGREDRRLKNWYGISAWDGNVTQIGLANNGLTGTLPRELGLLEHLETLGLYGNEIGGTIPPEIGDLPVVSILALGENRFEGEIPPELGNMPELRGLLLQESGLTGEIPAELGNASKLFVFSLYGNDGITGTIPESFGGLGGLRFLEIYNTGMSGPLPMSLINTEIFLFDWRSTDLCSPPNEEFQEWLNALPVHRGGSPCSA